jgi:hypothetical protein
MPQPTFVINLLWFWRWLLFLLRLFTFYNFCIRGSGSVELMAVNWGTTGQTINVSSSSGTQQLQ